MTSTTTFLHCEHQGCSCREWKAPTSKWVKNKSICKTCNHSTNEHAQKMEIKSTTIPSKKVDTYTKNEETSNITCLPLQSINTTVNLLYKWRNKTVIECMLDNENQSKLNDLGSILVSGYIKDILSKSAPSAIHNIIESFSQNLINRFEVRICSQSQKSKKYAIKNIDEMHENHLGYAKYSLSHIFNQNDWNDVEPYSIQARAVFISGLKGKYSKWLNFSTTSSFVSSIGLLEQHDYNAMFNVLWDLNVDLKGNDKINLKQWIFLWKSRNIKCNDYDLRRVYYHLGGKANNGYISKEVVRTFTVCSVYDALRSNFFVDNEWNRFQREIRKCAQFDPADYEIFYTINFTDAELVENSTPNFEVV